MTEKIFIVCLVALLTLSGCGRSKPIAAGAWEVNHGKEVDDLTLQEKDGALTGQITLDPAFIGGTFSVHGTVEGAHIELAFEAYGSNTTPSGSDSTSFILKGYVVDDTMSGSFTVFGPLSGLVSNPGETLNWTAKRRD